MKYLIICAAAVALSGCAYPTSSIEQGSAEGHLRFADAPIGALILVDGHARGARSGTESISVDVAPGRHLVEETKGGQTLFHAEFYVGPDSTVIVRSMQ